MQPQQNITSGTLSQLPHFDPVAQLCAGRSVWSATTTKQPIHLKHKSQSRTEGAVLSLLADIGTGVWSVKELAAHVRGIGRNIKQDTVRDYLHVLVVRGLVVKSMHGKPNTYWKA